MNRRKFLQTSLIGAPIVGISTLLYTWQVEPFWVEFVKKKMPIKNLPAHLVGKSIVQISDIHIGNRVDAQYLLQSFKETQKFNPDFVVYTGDFVSYEDKTQFGQLDKLLPYFPKGKLGTLGVLGNHDYGKNWSEQQVSDTITSLLTNAGITVLRNEQQTIAGLNFIGLDDFWGLNFKPNLVMHDIDPNQANLLFCHNPDACDRPIWNNYQGWILSGHTHGGQCKPPFLPPPLLPVKNKKYTAGEIDLGQGRTLYINRALGHLLQVRFNVRPEITVFEMVQG